MKYNGGIIQPALAILTSLAANPVSQAVIVPEPRSQILCHCQRREHSISKLELYWPIDTVNIAVAPQWVSIGIPMIMAVSYRKKTELINISTPQNLAGP